MAETQDAAIDKNLGASPAQIEDPRMRHEARRAFIWTAVVGLAVLLVYISQSLLVIFGALVFASMIDGGARLLGRVLPIGRGWRVALVLALTLLFFVWLVYFAGATISQDAAEFPTLLQGQIDDALDWARQQGFDVSYSKLQEYTGSLGTGLSTFTKALTGAAGGFATLLLIVVIGIYVAVDPKLYHRGVAWMVPDRQRDGLSETFSRMARTMRRLMAGRLAGMVLEGILTYLLLRFGGLPFGIEPVPMAALLAILTGLLAFVPNLGAIVSGLLMVLVGFSGGAEMGIFTIVVYLLVQNFDGYVVIPMIAKKTVDLAPALVLAVQLIMGILFGIIGLLFADPLLAMIKVALERRAESVEDETSAVATRSDGA